MEKSNKDDWFTHLQPNLAYSSKVFNPEDLLSNWLAVSGVILTTSLLFYHMSRVKSLKVKPYLAKTIAISLILLSTFYLIYALYPYYKRMNFVVESCNANKLCPKDQSIEVNILKYSYLGLGFLTVIIQLLVVYLVLDTI